MNLHEYTLLELLFVFGCIWLSGVMGGIAFTLSRRETGSRTPDTIRERHLIEAQRHGAGAGSFSGWRSRPTNLERRKA